MLIGQEQGGAGAGGVAGNAQLFLGAIEQIGDFLHLPRQRAAPELVLQTGEAVFDRMQPLFGLLRQGLIVLLDVGQTALHGGQALIELRPQCRQFIVIGLLQRLQARLVVLLRLHQVVDARVVGLEQHPAVPTHAHQRAGEHHEQGQQPVGIGAALRFRRQGGIVARIGGGVCFGVLAHAADSCWGITG